MVVIIKKISQNLIECIKLAKRKKSKIISIVGKNDGYAAKYSDACIIIPYVSKICNSIDGRFSGSNMASTCIS